MVMPNHSWCREAPNNGESSGTVSESKERIQGALMPTNTGPTLRWEHKVELWKHPKAGTLFTLLLLSLLLSSSSSANLTAMHVSMHCQDIMHIVLRYTIISRLKLLVSVCCHNRVCICRGYPDVVICLTRSICYAQCALVSFPANMNSAIIAELASCLRRGSRAMTP